MRGQEIAGISFAKPLQGAANGAPANLPRDPASLDPINFLPTLADSTVAISALPALIPCPMLNSKLASTRSAATS
jgi:hypothetical protein